MSGWGQCWSPASAEVESWSPPLTLGMPVCETALILPPSRHRISPRLLPSHVIVWGGKTGLPTHASPYAGDPQTSRADLGLRPWLRRKEIRTVQWNEGP